MENKIENNSSSRRGFLGGISKWLAGTAVLGLLANVFTAKELKGNGPPVMTAADPFIGGMSMIGFNFAPRSWAFCDGQLLAISSNSALFSLLGTSYGGDGRTTFGLPDLRGRVAIHPGTGPGLTTRYWGQRSGTENERLSTTQIPSHSHNTSVNTNAGDSSSPTGYMATNSEGIKHYSSSTNSTGGATSSSGGSQAHNNMPPFLGIYHVIALFGIYPSRS